MRFRCGLRVERRRPPSPVSFRGPRRAYDGEAIWRRPRAWAGTVASPECSVSLPAGKQKDAKRQQPRQTPRILEGSSPVSTACDHKLAGPQQGVFLAKGGQERVHSNPKSTSQTCHRRRPRFSQRFRSITCLLRDVAWIPKICLRDDVLQGTVVLTMLGCLSGPCVLRGGDRACQVNIRICF